MHREVGTRTNTRWVSWCFLTLDFARPQSGQCSPARFARLLIDGREVAPVLHVVPGRQDRTARGCGILPVAFLGGLDLWGFNVFAGFGALRQLSPARKLKI